MKFKVFSSVWNLPLLGVKELKFFGNQSCNLPLIAVLDDWDIANLESSTGFILFLNHRDESKLEDGSSESCVVLMAARVFFLL